MQNQALPPLTPGLSITVHRQADRTWYAVKSPGQGPYLRLGRSEYLIASGLDGRRTASDVCEALKRIEPELTISQDDVLRVTAWLAGLGLVGTAVAPASPTPEPTFSLRKLSINPIYTRIPLIDGRHLERLGGWLAPLVCLPVVIVLGILTAVAAVRVIGNWESFAAVTSDLFVSDSFLWWGLAWFVLKTAHELGHAVAAVRVGSQIRSAGISLVFMAPVPYVDISDLWTVSNRWHRILCCAGGMLVEIVLAALAALVALATENQALQYFCCAVATMGTVTTLAFNASPMVRFDGYFILSDLLNRPNLYSDAQLAARQFAKTCLQPWRPRERKMTFGLVAYGLACYQYRIVMMLTLAVWAVLAFQGLGLILVAWGVYIVIVGPFLKTRAARAALPPMAAPGGPATSPWPQRVWNCSLAAMLGLLLLWVPAPIQPATPGYVALRDPLTIRSDTEGFLAEVLVPQHGWVAAGQVIARLENPQLELEVALKRNEFEATEERIRLKRATGNLAELQAHQAKLDSLQLQLSQLEQKVERLEIRSPRSGTLVRNDLSRSRGLFLAAGEPLAVLAQDREYEIVASVSQEDVESLRAAVGQSLSVRVAGGDAFPAILEKVDPRASDHLEEPLLAAAYGGPIAVHRSQADNGEEELKVLAPRFAMHVRLDSQDASHVAPGQMVWLRNPGNYSNLWNAIKRWTGRKWSDVQQQSQAG